jgi:poly(A) polymerase Pap1
MQSLLKLNPLRDMDYLQRTIPDLATFRVAYRFIKTWAKQRGIYSSKLGYVGGIHITLLLSRICKLAFFQTGALSASTIVCTFFKHYSQFDWRNDMVYDPQFYKSEVPRYHRSSREPMVILSVHSPKVNVAHNASLPSLRTLEQEFKRAEQLLSKEGTTWMDIVGPASEAAGANEFLNSYTSYAKIDVQYWGGAVLKGRILVGWLEWRCVSLLVGQLVKCKSSRARN